MNIIDWRSIARRDTLHITREETKPEQSNDNRRAKLCRRLPRDYSQYTGRRRCYSRERESWRTGGCNSAFRYFMIFIGGQEQWIDIVFRLRRAGRCYTRGLLLMPPRDSVRLCAVRPSAQYACTLSQTIAIKISNKLFFFIFYFK